MPVTFPPRDARAHALRALIGDPDPSARHLAEGIRAVARRSFEAHVTPLVRAYFPALVHEKLYQKLYIGACDLYAPAPYLALVASPERPLIARVATTVAGALPLSPEAIARIGRAALELFGRYADADRHRRIILVAAFIVIADHLLDHELAGSADARGAMLAAVIDGRAEPTSPALSLCRALAVAMGAGLSADDRIVFDAAMDRVRAWIEAEVRAMRGEPDPEGIGHRRAGVEGTIDGLLFPVARFTGPLARAWMIDVSMFVQVADDWLDADDDARAARETPVTAGAWTFADVEAHWRRTIAGAEGLARAAGLGSPALVALLRSAYALMMRDVIDAMIARPGE